MWLCKILQRLPLFPVVWLKPISTFLGVAILVRIRFKLWSPIYLRSVVSLTKWKWQGRASFAQWEYYIYMRSVDWFYISAISSTDSIPYQVSSYIERDAKYDQNLLVFLLLFISFFSYLVPRLLRAAETVFGLRSDRGTGSFVVCTASPM